MKRSLSRKYFLICMSCVFVSILVIGIIFLVFSTRFFKQDKYNMMERNANIASEITANSYVENDYSGVKFKTIRSAFDVFSNTIDADFMLVNVDGEMFYHSNSEDIASSDFKSLPSSVFKKAISEGYKATGMIKGLTKTSSHIVGVPVIVEGKTIGAVFVYTSADDLMLFIKDVTQMLFLSAFIVLIVSFAVIYYITAKMVKPLKQMLNATHSFAEGDFSQRIPVYTEDEVGQLSMAFNNMASTLAVNEASRRSFIANVSHELKTPMTTIGGFVDGILDGTIPQEKEAQYLTIVSREVSRLKRLVHSMLDTARIDAGEMELKKTVFDISELVRQSTFTFEQLVDEKNVTVTGLEKDKEMVCADQDLIHQVVYNLMENAVKFVKIDGEISVNYEKKDGMLYTTIRNTCDGLGKEEVAKIFERFYKSDRSRTGNNNGVGLGLHIVKSIINYHQGEIKVNSEEGKYVEFVFAIEAAKENNKSEKVS